jgi:surface polysaccharide O-acyltransferase-like enzyme
MGIYLLHQPIILNVVALVLNKFITIPLLNFALILLCTLLLALIAVALIGRIPYGSLLFGVPQSRKKIMI